MNYREHPVPPSLGAVVETIWTLEACAGAMGDDVQPVVPDGRSEIVVHFGDAFERIDAGVPTVQAPILVAGQLESPLVLRPTGRIAVLGVRLRPAGAAAVLRQPQHELAGRTDDAREISKPLADWLTQVRESARSPDDAVSMIRAGLPRLADTGRLDRRVVRAADLIDSSPRWTVGGLADHVGLTPRQLERLFRNQVGLTPKRLLSIRRLQRALQALELAELSGGTRPGAMAALEGGYADQAHFVRECRALTGTTPGAYLLERAQLTGLFVSKSR